MLFRFYFKKLSQGKFLFCLPGSTKLSQKFQFLHMNGTSQLDLCCEGGEAVSWSHAGRYRPRCCARCYYLQEPEEGLSKRWAASNLLLFAFKCCPLIGFTVKCKNLLTLSFCSLKRYNQLISLPFIILDLILWH